jgi:fumarate hydratase class I
MPDGIFQDMFPLSSDTTPYRKLTGDFVGRETFAGRPILTVAPEALTLLARTAFADIAHLLRPGHLAQLRRILDDPEASANDRFVAFDLLKNANIAAGRVLPMCQDTGTAIIMGKKGQRLDRAAATRQALSEGVRRHLPRRPTCAIRSSRRSRCSRR